MNLQELDLTNKKAIFVDCDNTLALTLPAHNKAYELAFHLNEVPFDIKEHKKWAAYGGTTLMLETVTKKGYEHKVGDIIQDKQRLLPFCLDKFMVPNHELVKLIKDKSEEIPTIVVSNGRKRSIVQILERLGLLYYVGGVLTKEDFENSKPHPEPYLEALRLMNLKPEDVVVFEDNKIGINSAFMAGIEDIVKVTKFGDDE